MVCPHMAEGLGGGELPHSSYFIRHQFIPEGEPSWSNQLTKALPLNIIIVEIKFSHEFQREHNQTISVRIFYSLRESVSSIIT
jgi:hypothetical protein